MRSKIINNNKPDRIIQLGDSFLDLDIVEAINRMEETLFIVFVRGRIEPLRYRFKTKARCEEVLFSFTRDWKLYHH